MLIKGGTIFQDDKTFAKKDISFEKGRIVAITEPGSIGEEAQQVYDATGYYVLPGLIDIHSHGAMGHDFSDGDLEGLLEILRYQHDKGVTSYCPTSMTLSRENLLKLYRSLGNLEESTCQQNLTGKKLAHILGYNMEGPFLDKLKKGAHKEADIIVSDVDFFQRCNEACGNRICLVTVAPNIEGGLEFIQEVQKLNGITVSLGHTSADYATGKAALLAGATHVTHLFNAMSPFNHREPGLIGAALEDENCMIELICDGVHVHESMVRLVFKICPNRVVLISDSIRAAGLSDGIYELGGQQVSAVKEYAALSDGTIAGSVRNLFDCMQKAILFGVAPEDAIAAATMNPAKSIGRYDEVGSLSVGKRADIIIVDSEFNLVKVF